MLQPRKSSASCVRQNASADRRRWRQEMAKQSARPPQPPAKSCVRLGQTWYQRQRFGNSGDVENPSAGVFRYCSESPNNLSRDRPKSNLFRRRQAGYSVSAVYATVFAESYIRQGCLDTKLLNTQYKEKGRVNVHPVLHTRQSTKTAFLQPQIMRPKLYLNLTHVGSPRNKWCCIQSHP